MALSHLGGEVILRPSANGMDFYIVHNQNLSLISSNQANKTRNRLVTTLLLSLSLWSVPRFLQATTLTSVELFAKTNTVRAEHGLNILNTDSRLERAALAKANDMFAKSYFSHTAPSGALPWDFITSAGYHFTAAGENLAMQVNNSDEIFNAWMSSARHRDNLLSTKYREIGIATVNGMMNGKQTSLVVQFFGNRQSIDVPVTVSTMASPITGQATSIIPNTIDSKSDLIAPVSEEILSQKVNRIDKPFEQLVPKKSASDVQVTSYQVIHNPTIFRASHTQIDVRISVLVLSALDLYATFLMGIWIFRRSVFSQKGIPIVA